MQRAKLLLKARGRRAVECSKTFSDRRSAFKIATDLGYVYFPNPGNTRISKDPRAAANPYYGIRTVKEVGSHTCDSEGELIIRSDEGSWRLVGDKRIQLYVRKDFNGDAIKEAKSLLAEINSYIATNKTGDKVYDLYKPSLKTMHPLIKLLEAKGWPSVVQGKDIHAPTAAHYGYTLHKNPARKDGKWLVEKGSRWLARGDQAWQQRSIVTIKLYVRCAKPDDVAKFLKRQEFKTFFPAGPCRIKNILGLY